MPANNVTARAAASAPRRSKASSSSGGMGSPRTASRKQQRRGNAASSRQFAGAAATGATGRLDAGIGGADEDEDEAGAAAAPKLTERDRRADWHRRMHARAPGGYEPEEPEAEAEDAAEPAAGTDGAQ